jgi:hypothetical protein
MSFEWSLSFLLVFIKRFRGFIYQYKYFAFITMNFLLITAFAELRTIAAKYFVICCFFLDPEYVVLFSYIGEFTSLPPVTDLC